MCGQADTGQGCCCEGGQAGSADAAHGACRCGGNLSRHLVMPAIMLLLDREPSHGYSLLRRLSELGIADAALSQATVYRILSRLEEEGLAVHEHADDGQGPTRKVYSLTDEGRKALAEWRSHIERTRRILDWFEGGTAG